jgi:predicted MFS family arabinose efflux permease
VRLSLHTEKQLELDSLVATNRTAIVATIEPVWNRVLLSRQRILRLSRQLSALLMLCGCRKIIVKPGAKVITIEPSADALSMDEVVKLFRMAFKQVPKSRSTMMSLNSLFNDIGNVIAPAVGGALLVFTSGVYGVVELALGSIIVAESAVLLFLAKDPTRAPVGWP